MHGMLSAGNEKGTWVGEREEYGRNQTGDIGRQMKQEENKGRAT